MPMTSNHSAYFAASGCASATAATGRRISPPTMMTLRPSCLDANSSSSIASSGVYIGMMAAGMMRSAYGLNCSAVNTLYARQIARRIFVSTRR